MAKQPKTGPDWFSVKDAASYLQVGEPTLYRWMREKRITFRKVGDSTRFLQEDLDAMVEVHHSERDTGEVQAHCMYCGHDQLVTGRVQGTGRVYFRPQKTKFWTYRDANVKTDARMCARCGAISWFGDTSKLEDLRTDEAPAADE